MLQVQEQLPFIRQQVDSLTKFDFETLKQDISCANSFLYQLVDASINTWNSSWNPIDKREDASKDY